MKRIELDKLTDETIEGRLLFAALAKITTESQTDKTPAEVLEQCYVLAEQMYATADELDYTLNNQIIQWLESYKLITEANCKGAPTKENFRKVEQIQDAIFELKSKL